MSELFVNGGWQVRVDPDWATDAIRVHIFRYVQQGKQVASEYVNFGAEGSMILTEMVNGFFPDQPTLKFRRGDGLMRALAEALSEAGYNLPRAPEQAKIEGELAATKGHLADMRRIALNGIPKEDAA
jgi:hypothetical protein